MKQEAKELLVIKESDYWSTVESVVSNAVVQIVSHIERFNWQEPYRPGDSTQARGTGFFINQEGHILTAFHVVEDARSIWVHIPLCTRRTFEAYVIGVCPVDDIALIALVDEDYEFVKKCIGSIPFLTPGNSDALKRTDPILTLGYPLGGYGIKGTIGIVSGHEFIEGKQLLHITSSVNAGSSGGPVINMAGEVVGIAVAVVINAFNIGYAIAINNVFAILPHLYKQKVVRKPTFGIHFTHSGDKKCAYLQSPEAEGVYITQLFPGGILKNAGVLQGDILCEFDGAFLDVYGQAQVEWSRDKVSLAEIASRILPDKTVYLAVWRNGKRIPLSCDVTDKNPYEICMRYPLFEPIEYYVLGGIVLMNLAENHLDSFGEMAKNLWKYDNPEYKLKPRVVVCHVVIGTPVHAIQIVQIGDILTAINTIPIDTIEDIQNALPAILENDLVALAFESGILAVFSQEQLMLR